MHAEHRQLPHNPVDDFGSDTAWFPGGDHDEALSRMLYLVERGHGCGLIWGETGAGKSRLLREIQRQVRTPSTTVISLDLSGLSRADFTAGLLNQCGVGNSLTAAMSAAWIVLEDWLCGRTALQNRVVWLFDGLDAAAEALEPELLRLARLVERTQTRSTMIITVPGPGLIDHRGSFADFVAELSPWDHDDSRAFIEHFLKNAGGSTDMVAESAWSELLAAGQGNPRRLLRIMEVALAAGGALGTPQLSTELITAVIHQLGWTAHEAVRMMPVGG